MVSASLFCFKYLASLFYFRKYQTLVDQQENLLGLKMILNKKLSSFEHRTLTEFDMKMQARSVAHLAELEELQLNYEERKKYLQQKITDTFVQRMFKEVLNMREIICMEIKRCEQIEKSVFEKLKYI